MTGTVSGLAATAGALTLAGPSLDKQLGIGKGMGALLLGGSLLMLGAVHVKVEGKVVKDKRLNMKHVIRVSHSCKNFPILRKVKPNSKKLDFFLRCDAIAAKYKETVGSKNCSMMGFLSWGPQQGGITLDGGDSSLRPQLNLQGRSY